MAPEPNPVFDVHLPVSDAGVAYARVNLVPIWPPAYYRAVERRFDPRYATHPRHERGCYTVKENDARYALVVLELHVLP